MIRKMLLYFSVLIGEMAGCVAHGYLFRKQIGFYKHYEEAKR